MHGNSGHPLLAIRHFCLLPLSAVGLDALAAPIERVSSPLAGGVGLPQILIGLALLASLAALLLIRLQTRKKRVETTLNALPDAIIQVDATGELNYLNPAGEAMLGTGIAAPWHFIDHETRSPLLDVLLTQANKEGLVRIPAGARLINRHGLELEVEGICQPLRDQHGRINNYLLQLRDVSEENEWRRQQPDLWDRDPVSSLPGCSFMADRLNRALQKRRAADRPMTYLDISFTGIRAVYDEIGSQAGNTLIRHLAALLRAHVRDTDLVARMDDETFAVLLTACPAEISQRIAGEIQTALDGFGFEWDNLDHKVQGRLGKVDIPPFDGSLDELLAAARPATVAS
ncbi:MAG: diguanylate cyclase [Hydrogenophilaceae bacterium]